MHKQIATGDIVLFSNNTPTAFLLRTTTQSTWNHIGIAVRHRKGKICSGTKGRLCVLETNSCKRKDPIKGDRVKGVGFSSWSYLKRKYNRIDIRQIKDEARPDNFVDRLRDFSEKYRSYRFPESLLPFVSVWLGCEFGAEEKALFCSQLVGRYLQECLVRDSELEIPGLPESHIYHMPRHYDVKISGPNKVLGKQVTVWTQEADLFYVILTPIIIAAFIMLLLVMYNS